jgi:hypothetical protein
LHDHQQRQQWLGELEAIDWNVFIQGPPHGQSEPAQVVKYLARYLTGGPIADRRLISADNHEVVFWARPKKTDSQSKQRNGMPKPKPFRLTHRQFMQRWTMHILPRGFVRSRCYGGYHGKNRTAYLARGNELLTPPSPAASDQAALSPAEPERLKIEVAALDTERAPLETGPEALENERPIKRCPHCDGQMMPLRSHPRPSWREIFASNDYRFPLRPPVPPQPDRGLTASRPPPQLGTAASGRGNQEHQP